MSGPEPGPYEDLHELVTFEDPDEYRTWVFDVTFLTSSWTCIFGQGCLGVLTEEAPELEQGCCSYGAHFVDDDDHDDTVARIRSLTPEQWQFHEQGTRDGATRRDDGDRKSTRMN